MPVSILFALLLTVALLIAPASTSQTLPVPVAAADTAPPAAAHLRIACERQASGAARCTALVRDPEQPRRLALEPFDLRPGGTQTRLRLHPVTGELLRLTLYYHADAGTATWHFARLRGGRLRASARGVLPVAAPRA